MAGEGIGDLPGFRRRFRITPEVGVVRAEVEDDFHCMAVEVRHADGIACEVVADMRRVPWTTCPGACAELQQTFSGEKLAAFHERGNKKSNCTHLYDLALLAAAHAADSEVLVFDIRVSDPVAGQRFAELYRNGVSVLAWTEQDFKLVAPDAVAGLPLFAMQGWIETLDEMAQEHARLLRWGTMLANGRAIPLENQSDATKMPANCYTFQPERARDAKRVGEIRDFSRGISEPLGN